MAAGGRHRRRTGGAAAGALAVDASQTTREGLKDLVGSGWSEFEFDSEARKGLPRAPLPEEITGDQADVVN